MGSSAGASRSSDDAAISCSAGLLVLDGRDVPRIVFCLRVRLGVRGVLELRLDGALDLDVLAAPEETALLLHHFLFGGLVGGLVRELGVGLRDDAPCLVLRNLLVLLDGRLELFGLGLRDDRLAAAEEPLALMLDRLVLGVGFELDLRLVDGEDVGVVCDLDRLGGVEALVLDRHDLDELDRGLDLLGRQGRLGLGDLGGPPGAARRETADAGRPSPARPCTGCSAALRRRAGD